MHPMPSQLFEYSSIWKVKFKFPHSLTEPLLHSTPILAPLINKLPLLMSISGHALPCMVTGWTCSLPLTPLGVLATASILHNHTHCLIQDSAH